MPATVSPQASVGSSTSTEPALRAPVAAVFLLSLAVLVYEFALTRAFSVLLQYHFAFLAVSTAICGLGLGGLWLHEWRRRRRSSAAFLPLAALAFAGSSLGCSLVLFQWVFVHHLDWYWFAGGLVLLPFACAGAFLAEVFATHAEQSGRLYAADLIGAAVGAIVVIAILQYFGGINTCLAACPIAAVAALLCGGPARVRQACALAALLTVALVAANARSGFIDIRPVGAASAGKEYSQFAQRLFVQLAAPPDERPRIVGTRWDAFSRLDVVDSPHLGERRDAVYQVFTNGNVPTQMYRLAGDLRTGDASTLIAPLVAEKLFPPVARLPFEIRPHARVLCIGPGGGMDVLLALHGGAKAIDGVEVNPGMLSVMNRHAAFNGHVYERPGVKVVTAEGRSYLQRSDQAYDLIYLALTQSGVGHQGVAMTESYIFTTEAFASDWQHLAPGGELAIVLHNPLFTLRLVNTAVAMLRREGLSDAQIASRLTLMGGGGQPYVFLFLLKKDPFVRAEAVAVRQFVQKHELRYMHTPPLRDGIFDEVMDGRQSIEASIATMVASYPERANVAPCPDDRPFFLDLNPGLPPNFGGLCLGVGLLAGGFSAWAFWSRRKDNTNSLPLATPTYFAALGVGFMLVEIPLIQKLSLPLEHPTLALSVILFSLLVGGGLGAWITQRVAPDRLARLIVGSALGAAIVTIALAGILTRADWLLRLSLPARMGLIGGALMFLGGFLGMPFPGALRQLAPRHRRHVPWMWGLNGVMSVVGSLGAALVAKWAGFNVTLCLGAAMYVLVALLGAAASSRRRT
ncbi:MAG TPA: class I SAM-dependent methyltransferase [Opitutaceae bacterium]|nr:class I SAM-dependent methyltransferase [Opitutaceae bacterium]